MTPKPPIRRGARSFAQGSSVVPGQPVVAIVGCPNVGKSTLFNRITGRRDAVVDSTPGITRDRRQAGAEWSGRTFQLLDTGGMDPAEDDEIGTQVYSLARGALAEADLILLVVDVTVAPTGGDMEIIDSLRGTEIPVMIVANKCDSPARDAGAYNLLSLGLGDVYPVSAQHGRGTGDLLDAVIAALPPSTEDPEAEDAPEVTAVSIIGRPNVGKSSLLNALLGEERVVVHGEPGTTRDAIDTTISVDGTPVVLIDTAGLRRRGKARDDVERYSMLRTVDAAERSAVAIVVCDAVEGVTDGDLAVCEQAAIARCCTLLVVNKWDLAQPDLDDVRGLVSRKTRQRPPIEVCSTVTGEGLHRIIPAALRLAERARTRVPTSRLNDLLRELARERPGPRKGNTRLSLRFLTQIAESPPILRLDVNDRGLMTRDYGFWIENRIRREFDLEGVPVIIQVRGRS